MLLRSALALIIACAGPAFAAEPTSPAVKAEMIRLIGMLEEQPHHPDAREMRGTVLRWLTDAPDVSVMICEHFLAIENFEPDEPAGELVFQQPFSEAKFILENPDKAQDGVAVHVAGIEGALRAYAVMKTEDPKLVVPAMESLVKLQAEQKLPEHVAKAMKKCK